MTAKCLIFGVLLAIVAMSAAMVGDVLLLKCFSAPAGESDNPYIALLAIPCLWAWVGSRLSKIDTGKARVSLVLIVLAHYAAVVGTLIEAARDPLKFSLATYIEVDIAGGLLYLVGQVVVWRMIVDGF